MSQFDLKNFHLATRTRSINRLRPPTQRQRRRQRLSNARPAVQQRRPTSREKTLIEELFFLLPLFSLSFGSRKRNLLQMKLSIKATLTTPCLPIRGKIHSHTPCTSMCIYTRSQGTKSACNALTQSYQR